MKKGNFITTAFISVLLLLSPSVINRIKLNTESKREIDNDKVSELTLPKQDNISLMIDIMKITERKKRFYSKLRKLQKQEYKAKPYDAGICRGHTFRSNTNIRIM